MYDDMPDFGISMTKRMTMTTISRTSTTTGTETGADQRRLAWKTTKPQKSMMSPPVHSHT